MKYWVYKDARILGPFDKDAVAGLPGVDSSTLVCSGDAAVVGDADWRPVGDVSELAELTSRSPRSGEFKETTVTYGALDEQFQWGSPEIFRDPEVWRSAPSPSSSPAPDDAPAPKTPDKELNRTKDRVSELTVHLDLLYKRVTELEASQTNLMQELADKEAQLKAQTAAAAAAPPPPAPIERKAFRVVEPEESSPPPPPPPPVEEAAPPAQAGLRINSPAPLKVVEPEVPPVEMVFAPEPEAVANVEPVYIPVEEPALAPEPIAAVPEPIAAPPEPEPTAEVAPPTFDWSSLAPAAEPKTSAPQPDPFPTPAPLPQLPPTSAMANLFVPPSQQEPAQFPEIATFPTANSVITEFSMPATEPPTNASTQEMLARLAKPTEEPVEEEPRPRRNNLKFLIGAGVLVVIMTVSGHFLLRHPKDLKQMAELDDGRSRVGAEPPDESARQIQRPVAPPASAGPTAAAPVAASAANIDAAISMVKDYPLGGDRRSVGQWLTYSYLANPGAGKESWSASETADKTYLVEYRFDPAAPGAPNVHYLFAADVARGFVTGQNQEATRMLAGESRKSSRQLKIDAAIRLVKDFPLDGERGSVAEWLSKAAGAHPGKETWTSTETGNKTFVIEYRRLATRRIPAAHYLFAVDTKSGFVIGKNLDATRLLAGGQRAAPRRTPKPTPKAAPKRAPAKPKPVQRVLPKPSARPPVEDDGSFGADTVRPN